MRVYNPQRQEDYKCESSLDYVVRPRLKKERKGKKRREREREREKC
jgi:hypothetical protein